MRNPEMRNMPDHYPQRGDQVEAWIRERRNDHLTHSEGIWSEVWTVLDNLLDEYRLAADQGMSLEEVVNIDITEVQPERLVKKKPKISRPNKE